MPSPRPTASTAARSDETPRQGRRLASLSCFLLGSALLGGAGAFLLTARLAPYEGMQDLGRVVGGMILAALSVVPFLLAIVLADETTPRWRIVASMVGAIVGMVPALVLVVGRF